jgi:large subunit ribosomal protein L35
MRTEMPKLKTHRGAAKRFKKTATGKFMRSKAFKRHILTSKSRSRKRGLKGTVVVSKSNQAELRRMLPD